MRSTHNVNQSVLQMVDGTAVKDDNRLLVSATKQHQLG